MSGIQSNNIQLSTSEPLAVTANRGGNAVETFVDESQSSVLIIAANSERKKVIIINESKKSLYLRYQSPAIDKEGIQLNSGDYWIETEYIGNIYGIWSNGADKGARIIEIS
jgi:hypothetical protein